MVEVCGWCHGKQDLTPWKVPTQNGSAATRSLANWAAGPWEWCTRHAIPKSIAWLPLRRLAVLRGQDKSGSRTGIPHALSERRRRLQDLPPSIPASSPSATSVKMPRRHDPYIVLEYVDGEALNRILARERKLSLERALQFTEEVAAALPILCPRAGRDSPRHQARQYSHHARWPSQDCRLRHRQAESGAPNNSRPLIGNPHKVLGARTTQRSAADGRSRFVLVGRDSLCHGHRPFAVSRGQRDHGMFQGREPRAFAGQRTRSEPAART